MSYFYISDLHLGHYNVLKFDGRPYETIKENNEALIANWNKVANQNDTVFVLGDMVWGSSENWKLYLPRMNGKKVLIKGNHDKIDDMNSQYFEEITEYKEISDCGYKVIMCHYPIFFYKQCYRENHIMLYGHVHNTHEHYQVLEHIKQIKMECDAPNKSKCQAINVGCMMPYVNFTPQKLVTYIKENERINDEVTSKIVGERIRRYES